MPRFTHGQKYVSNTNALLRYTFEYLYCTTPFLAVLQRNKYHIKFEYIKQGFEGGQSPDSRIPISRASFLGGKLFVCCLTTLVINEKLIVITRHHEVTESTRVQCLLSPLSVREKPL